ncbi:MAG: hypothetical protein OXC60_00830 [Litoreibacter sp.]|nr:hypothetical protein [Litoreibacter sp.]
MNLALKALKLMLIVAALSCAIMLFTIYVQGSEAAWSALYLNGFYLIACLFFMATLKGGSKFVMLLFLGFNIILLVGSKMGGLTLTSFPAYIMAILSFGGFAGAMQFFSAQRKGAPD